MNSVKVGDIFTYQNDTYVVHLIQSDGLFHMHVVGYPVHVVSVAITQYGMAAVACKMPGFNLQLLPELFFNKIKKVQNG